MISENKAAESKTTTSKQEARAKLRESFLRAVTELNGELLISHSIFCWENTFAANIMPFLSSVVLSVSFT